MLDNAQKWFIQKTRDGEGLKKFLKFSRSIFVNEIVCGKVW